MKSTILSEKSGHRFNENNEIQRETYATDDLKHIKITFHYTFHITLRKHGNKIP